MVEAASTTPEDEPKLKAALEEADDDAIQVFDVSKTKKKKKKKKKAEGEAAASSKPKAEDAAGFNWNLEGHKEYEFSELLDRIETIMNEKSAMADEEGKDVKGELPQTKFISIKTSIMNFDVLC